jgi:hypothetical protein
MYNPETFFNMKVLKEVLSNYDWSIEYELLETNTEAIILKFPKCSIVISEGFESNMNAHFLNFQTGRNNIQHSLSLFDAVNVYKPIFEKNDVFKEPERLIRNLEVEPSLDKVKDGLHNICLLLKTYLSLCIEEGDFSWVDEYNKQNHENSL